MKFIFKEQIKSPVFYHAVFITVMLFANSACAEEADYQFGVGLLSFDYTEYRDNGEFLDGETGLIPGIVLKRKQYHQRLYTELVGQLYGNTIKYDGQTQGGIPVKTDSVAVIVDTHFKLGMRLKNIHEPYLGLGYRYWYRQILNGQDINGAAVAGLLEEYYWFYGILGYTANFAVSEKVSLGFDLRYTKMLNAKMDVDFLGFNNYDDSQVNLGNESGARFAIPVKINLNEDALIVTPYYEIIDIGRSNSVRLTSGGVPVSATIYEPRSETRNVGIEIMWLW